LLLAFAATFLGAALVAGFADFAMIYASHLKGQTHAMAVAALPRERANMALPASQQPIPIVMPQRFAIAALTAYMRRKQIT
jgi:hypothetical protein